MKVVAYNFHRRGRGFSRTDLWFRGAIPAFSIFLKELERKVEKLKHMKLEIMPPEIKNESELPARE